MKKQQLHAAAKIVAGQSPASSTYNTNGDGLPFFQRKADFDLVHNSSRSGDSKGRVIFSFALDVIAAKIIKFDGTLSFIL